jgi:predicted nucleic acid-binding protein
MPRRRLVLDASTAILLAKIDLLREVTARGSVVMAETAVDEALARDSHDARMIRSLLDERRIERVAAPAGADGLMRDFRIDRGEAETIAVARETGAICATDDGPAIRCCRALGIPFTSAIGLLAAMAEEGVVASALALELLAKLQRFGRYDARILEDVSRRIRAAPSSGNKGESPP